MEKISMWKVVVHHIFQVWTGIQQCSFYGRFHYLSFLFILYTFNQFSKN